LLGVWAMRYVSAERSIAAAGAAFAYVEDDSAGLTKDRGSPIGRTFRRLRRAAWRALLVTGLVIA
jgi:hypothetical protein